MKKLLLLSLFFCACQKQIVPKDSIQGPLKFANASLADRVWQLKNVGKYSDTCAVAQNGDCILFIGDSYHERMLYANWAITWKGLPVLNRAIGGTTAAERYKYIYDLVTVYHPKVIVMSEGNNEYLRIAGTNPTNRDGSRLFLPSFNSYFNEIRRQNPKAKIVIMGMLTCPKLYIRKWNPDIANVTNKWPVPYPDDYSWSLQKVAFRDGGVYTDLRDKYLPWNMSNFESDSIHPKLSTYSQLWYPKIKPIVDSLYKLN